MTVSDIIKYIEEFAPTAYQESYDNCGLQVGDMKAEVTQVLLTLDVTEEVMEEAKQKGCNLIIAHHPLIFSGLKRIADRNYVERVVKNAIKNDISIYAAHTNLDNVREGVNAKICEKLGLKNTKILSEKAETILKLFTYAPLAAADKVRDALFAAGAGHIGNYKECSYNIEGTGTFRPGEGTDPTIGEPGGPRENVNEIKIEVLVPVHAKMKVLQALRAAHPYEEVAYEYVALANMNQEKGAGMIGELAEPMDEQAFLAFLKENMKTACIRHTTLLNKKISKVAVCGGSGSFLLRDAIAHGADVFVTGDFKYHQFFDAEQKIIIADIGHYESEQFTPEIFAAILNKKIPNFAPLLSTTNTNPVNYFC